MSRRTRTRTAMGWLCLLAYVLSAHGLTPLLVACSGPDGHAAIEFAHARCPDLPGEHDEQHVPGYGAPGCEDRLLSLSTAEPIRPRSMDIVLDQLGLANYVPSVLITAGAEAPVCSHLSMSRYGPCLDPPMLATLRTFYLLI